MHEIGKGMQEKECKRIFECKLFGERHYVEVDGDKGLMNFGERHNVKVDGDKKLMNCGRGTN